jgi:hypothetical protein
MRFSGYQEPPQPGDQECRCGWILRLESLRMRRAMGATWIRCGACEYTTDIAKEVEALPEDHEKLAAFKKNNPDWRLRSRRNSRRHGARWRGRGVKSQRIPY